MRAACTCLLVLETLVATAAEPNSSEFLTSIPGGFYLHAYDDCGVANRQPHVLMTNAFLSTFDTSDTDAGLKERSAVFGTNVIQAVYTNLDPKLSYLLALTYANDHDHRVQSLEANGVVLHGPYALPSAKATRVIVNVPAKVTGGGQMTLTWKMQGEANPTVSIIELWANAPAVDTLRITVLAGLPASLQGQVLDLAYDGVEGAEVRLLVGSKDQVFTTATGRQGTFSFSRQRVEALSDGRGLRVTARRGIDECRVDPGLTNLFFEPKRYLPLPQRTAGLSQNSFLLDGTWAANPAPSEDCRGRSMDGPGWVPFNVPGQWLQQGLDVPKDKTVSVATEFSLPQQWAGKRIILRFDAIHAGTTYWLNGHKLGYSENLFTPVEWDITEAAVPGQTNRLDLEMKLATISEELSHSSGYAFHNLGGIDRSVRVFALPPTHVRHLHLDAELDEQYQDGDVRLNLLLDSGAQPEKDLSLEIKLRDPTGKMIKHSLATVPVPSFTGAKPLELITHVVRPLQWSAESPALYCLRLELRKKGATLERIERNVGFRRIEIRQRQLYLNGHRIKIAGACHHEFDPLNGRANTARFAEPDVRLLKQANLNWIRTSHYPPTSELLDATDRLGMYVEAEAPFCWVGQPIEDQTHLRAILTPTSAMIDNMQSHPSVILWSLANESSFYSHFFYATRMCKELDPTRPTTFNNPDLDGSPFGGITDIANTHYPAWPYEGEFANDPRPIYLGEYFFEITHEQTDVGVNPGLRELWGHGHAEPESAFGQACALEYTKPVLKPGLKSGGWSDIYHSDRIIGGSIWAALDEAFYFSETKHAGYAWHHGFWGLIDAWRRPKPEWWLARHVFSPVWLQTRHVDFTPGQKAIRLPVENRYAFTDFSQLKFRWELAGTQGEIKAHVAPGSKGQLVIPVPRATTEGDLLRLRVTGPGGSIIHESFVCLGKEKTRILPRPSSGAPHWSGDGQKIVIQGTGFSLVFDRVKGDFDAADPRHTSAVISFPRVHLTRYDFGDLNGPNSPPYCVFPDDKTRKFELEVIEEALGLRLTVRDRYQDFSGSTSWLLDTHGRGVISCDYKYSGRLMDTREAGIRFLLKPTCDEVRWKRWSEWGVFPIDSISRTEGSAKAHRAAAWGATRWDQRPAWPWALDETELGTADFRSIKFNVYEAALAAGDGSGLTLHANADAHFRAALAPGGVAAHLLWRCPLGQVPLKPDDHIQGEFIVELGSQNGSISSTSPAF